MKTALATWICFSLVLACSVSFSVAAADPGPGPNIDPKADSVLRKSAEFYAAAKYLHCDVNFKMSVEAPGTRREIWAVYGVTLERPNKAALLLTDGVGASIVSNGQRMTTYVPALNKYSSKKSPDTLDQFFSTDEVGLINRSLGEMLFLNRLLVADPYEAMIGGSTRITYKGLEDLNGGKAHHLVLKRPDIDWHMWIDDGDKPFLRKLSPEVTPAMLAQVEGGKGVKMDLSLKFDNWSTNVPAKDAFVFLPPEGAEEVDALFDDGNEDGKNPLVGKVPPVTKLSMLDGSALDLADYKGKNVIVVDFWASWCGPCLQSLPIVQEIEKQYAGKGVVFLTVNFGEDPEKIKTFLEKKGYNFKVALDKGGELARQFAIRGIPFTMVIGKDGNVLHVHSGLQPDFKEELTQELDAAIKGEEEGMPTSAERQPK